MFPYIEQPVFQLGPIQLTAFPLFVVAAVIVGHELAVRRAAARGFDRELASSLIAWTIFFGFVGSHLFDLLFYQPRQVREHPLVLLQIWASMSSFGGMLGGILGACWIMRRKGLSRGEVFALLDVVAFAFPFAWIFGRAGCALAHDHVGVPTTHWLGVRFPDGTKFDLGSLELFYTVGVAGIFILLDRKPWPTGFFLGLFFLLYGPVRFALDTLRTGDARYLGWTPGQFASVAATLLGVGILRQVLRPR